MSRIFRVGVELPDAFGATTITRESVYKPKWWWILLSNSACKVAIMLHLHKLQSAGEF
jgi:hypothetical protein